MAADPKMGWESAVMWLKAQPGNEAIVEACFFDDPLSAAAERYYQSTEWLAVRRFFAKGRGRALDIGSGRGISAYALARDGWMTTALEPDPSVIVGSGAIRQLASETNLSIDVVETWGEALPFSDGNFDLVHVRQALHHARDLRQLCREISRVLKYGGMFIATREHVLSRKQDLNEFFARHPLHHLYGGENAYLLADYTDAIHDAGIHLKKILNPLDSDINTYPETRESIKLAYARKMRLPHPSLIPNFVLSLKGTVDKRPGRLYSFVGCKGVG